MKVMNKTTQAYITKVANYLRTLDEISKQLQDDEQYKRAIKYNDSEKAEKRIEQIVNNIIDGEAKDYLNTYKRYAAGDIQTPEEFSSAVNDSAVGGSMLGGLAGAVGMGITLRNKPLGFIAGGAGGAMIGGLGARHLTKARGPQSIKKPKRDRVNLLRGILSQLKDKNSETYERLIKDNLQPAKWESIR